jgi:hypothetical protein
MKKLLLLLTLNYNIYANELPFIEDSRYLDYRDDYSFKLDLNVKTNQRTKSLYEANKLGLLQDYVLANIGQKYALASKDSINIMVHHNQYIQIGVSMFSTARVDDPVFPVIHLQAEQSFNYTYGYKFVFDHTTIFPKINYIKEKKINEIKIIGELLDYKFQFPKQYSSYYDESIRFEQNIENVILFYDQLSFKNRINNYGFYLNEKTKIYVNKYNLGADINWNLLTFIVQSKRQGLALDLKLFKAQILKEKDLYFFGITF